MSAAALLQLLETTSYFPMFVAGWKSIFYEDIQILAYLLKYLLAFESFKADLDAYVMYWNTQRRQVKLKGLISELLRGQSF